MTTPEPTPAVPLLGEEVLAAIHDELLEVVDHDGAVAKALDIRAALHPLVAALVAERERLARIDERLKCAAACDRLGAPDVASIIRDSAA